MTTALVQADPSGRHPRAASSARHPEYPPTSSILATRSPGPRRRDRSGGPRRRRARHTPRRPRRVPPYGTRRRPAPLPAQLRRQRACRRRVPRPHYENVQEFRPRCPVLRARRRASWRSLLAAAGRPGGQPRRAGARVLRNRRPSRRLGVGQAGKGSGWMSCTVTLAMGRIGGSVPEAVRTVNSTTVPVSPHRRLSSGARPRSPRSRSERADRRAPSPPRSYRRA